MIIYYSVLYNMIYVIGWREAAVLTFLRFKSDQYELQIHITAFLRVLVHWSTRPLVHWSTGLLVPWSGSLVGSTLCDSEARSRTVSSRRPAQRWRSLEPAWPQPISGEEAARHALFSRCVGNPSTNGDAQNGPRHTPEMLAGRAARWAALRGCA